MMNARQRRLQKRLVAPAVLKLIEACEGAAQVMRETGQTMTHDECSALADGLREMVRANPDWMRVALGERHEA